MDEWIEAVVRWVWDPVRRVVDGFGVDDVLLGARPYTAEETAAADAYAAFLARGANATTIDQNLLKDLDQLATRITEMTAIVAIPNATVNASPATHIKNVAQAARDIAQAERRLIRKVLAVLDGVR